MQEEIKKIGEIFKTKRKESNLSLKEVENATSIRASYLKAIEEGCFDQVLSSIYVHGFIRQYALFLGIDYEKLAKQYPNAFKTTNKEHDFSYGIGTLEVRGSMGGGVKWFPNLLWAALGAGLLILAWYLIKYLGLI